MQDDLRERLSASLRELHTELGIPADYAADGSLPVYEEASRLVEIGPNLVGRMQRLTPLAAARWEQMVEAARDDGITLMVVSGYRSFEYQAALIRKKLNAGQVDRRHPDRQCRPRLLPASCGRRRGRGEPGHPAADRGIRGIRGIPVAYGRGRRIRLRHDLSARQSLRLHLRTLALGPVRRVGPARHTIGNPRRSPPDGRHAGGGAPEVRGWCSLRFTLPVRSRHAGSPGTTMSNPAPSFGPLSRRAGRGGVGRPVGAVRRAIADRGMVTDRPSGRAPTGGWGRPGALKIKRLPC